MIFSKYQKDWIIVDETNYKDVKEKNKMHLIKLDFDRPTREKVYTVINNFPNTNRYIVSNDIKFYNHILKNNKKYYVENGVDSSLVSFFRKNNKILMNMENLNPVELDFIIANLTDVLNNVEVVLISEEHWTNTNISDKLEKWSGNVLIW